MGKICSHCRGLKDIVARHGNRSLGYNIKWIVWADNNPELSWDYVLWRSENHPDDIKGTSFDERYAFFSPPHLHTRPSSTFASYHNS